MTRYLLDTHIAIWFLLGNSKLAKNIREEIEYFQDIYFVSVVSLQEIVLLKKIQRIRTDMSLQKIIELLKNYNIGILELNSRHIETYETLSSPIINGKQHDDPFDRLLISQSIADKMTLISADKKFPFYKDRGFKLREND